MKREDFIGLPPSVALGILWDAFPGLAAKLEPMLVPRVAAPPKYDDKIFRSGGFQWASEMDLQGLRYWHMRYTESASKGGQYAEQDAQRAKAMQFWIEWRLVSPHAAWSGQRNKQPATAEPPSAKPKVHAREELPKRDSQRPPPVRRFEDEDPVDDSYGEEDDGTI